MRPLLLGLTALLCTCLGLQAQVAQQNYYAGRLGEYMVYAALSSGTEGPLQGRYFYQTQRKEITLTGSTKAGKITLQEKVNGEVTGNWRGERDNFSFRGTWTSPKGKELAFQLYPAHVSTYQAELDRRSLADIQDKNLRALCELYDEQVLPFPVKLKGEDGGKEVPKSAWTYIFADTSEMFYYNALYAGQIFFQPSYFGLLTLHSYSPGAFGIYNDFIRMATFRYDGRVISQLELGCYGCYDSNMGSGDYYATSDSCWVTPQQITAYRTDEHGSLDMEEGQESFLELTQDTLFFQLAPDGAVVPE